MAKNRSSKPFERIFVDIKGPFETMGLGNYKYILGVVDDYSRLKIVIPLTHRGKIVEALSDIEGQLIRASGYKVSIIRMDNAGENKSSDMTAWMTKIGAKPEYTSPHSSESNGVVERAFQTIGNLARTLMLQGGFKKSAWPELFRTATYLENRLPNMANPDQKSPVEVLKGSPPDLSNLHIIGSKCYVHVHAAGRQALDDRAFEGKFLGYSSNSKNFKVLINNHKIVESSHVVFEDTTSTVPSVQDPTNDSDDFRVDLPSLPTISDGWTQVGPSGHHNLTSSSTSSSTNSVRPSKTKVFPTATSTSQNLSLGAQTDHVVEVEITDTSTTNPNTNDDIIPVPKDLYNHLDDNIRSSTRIANKLKPKYTASKATAFKVQITQRAAMKDKRFRIAMLTELVELFTMGAIKIVKLPANAHTIGSIWVHKVKTDSKGDFARAKSRLCPLGNQQIAHVDYNPNEIESPALSLTSVFILLSIIVVRNMYDTLLDVKGAFRIPYMEERIFLKFPPGMIGEPDECLEAINSLNGLKQSGRNWHKKADKFLTDDNFQPTSFDKCLYYKWVGTQLMLIGLYVDDFRVAADSEELLQAFINKFNNTFETSTNDNQKYLGMNIIHDREQGLMTINQAQFIEDALIKYNLTDCYPVSTPSAPGTKLEKYTGEETCDFPYREAIGTLLWIARCSRPDIMYAVNQCGAHCNKPGPAHVIAIKRIFKYLKGTKELCLTLHRQPDLQLIAFADADDAGEPEISDNPMRSLSGMVIGFKGVGPICTISKLQTTISRSSAESEYRCVGDCAAHIVGIRDLLEELDFKQLEPTIIYEDNQACIKMTESILCNSRTRHIKRDHHFIRQLVADKEVKLIYLATLLMIADICTKALPEVQFVKLRGMLLDWCTQHELYLNAKRVCYNN
jgi:hypothetical protein